DFALFFGGQTRGLAFCVLLHTTSLVLVGLDAGRAQTDECCAGLLVKTQFTAHRSVLNEAEFTKRRTVLSLEIREATRADAKVILGFITELAIYEKAEHEVLTSVAEIDRSLFDEPSPAKALICLLDDEPIGVAVYFLSYSTGLGRKGLYLEDLFVSAQH